MWYCQRHMPILDLLRTRVAFNPQTMELLDWLVIQRQAGAAIFTHLQLADVLGVDGRRIGQILGNLAHVQNFHNLIAVARVGTRRESGRRVSIWRLQA
jgi:hypothetical protein